MRTHKLSVDDIRQWYTAVLEGNAKAAKESTDKALAPGTEPLELVQEYMVPAMNDAGRPIINFA